LSKEVVLLYVYIYIYIYERNNFSEDYVGIVGNKSSFD
jgi:hypothetical protein